MTFRKKIEVIILSNPYMIRSVNGLEKFCGFGMSTLQRAYESNEEPSIYITKKIIQKLRIPRSWWDNPIGEPFVDIYAVYRDMLTRIETLELQVEKLEKENKRYKAKQF